MLQRNGNQPEVAADQVECQIFGAGETDRRDEVPGRHGVRGVVPPRGGDRAHIGPQLAVGHGVEAGEQSRGGTPGRGVGAQCLGPPAHRGPIGVALDEQLQNLGQAQARLARRLLQRQIGLGVAELFVGRGQLADAGGDPLARRASRANFRALHIAGHGPPLVQLPRSNENSSPRAGLPVGACDDGHTPGTAGDAQATTWMGSPTLTWLKYQAALSGLRLMHPWLTLA